MITVKFKEYKFSTTFHGDADAFIKNNKWMFQDYFFNQIDADVDEIMKDFRKNFEKTLKSLKSLVLPSTKDLLLWKVIEEFKFNIIKVADLFEEKSVKSTLLNIFK